jgi:2-keto-4-pentenoate hydratase/2-oxohepta-3-ene-1,7-dioic acid hydratase in catechol pathway
MRIANIAGRLSLLASDTTALDVKTASAGQFSASPQQIYEQWDEFVAWVGHADTGSATPFNSGELESPAPTPRQVFAIGLNYADHAAESGFAAPEHLPPTFTKWPSAITGPYGDITLPDGGHTDWEVELVAVIGRTATAVAEADGWSHVAGLAVGQDLSERIVQLRGPAPQFGLGKSFEKFAPIGPWLVTPDEFDDPDDLALGCSINGEPMQEGRTRDLLCSVPALVARLSAIVTLFPGDVIFTGTPAGVGLGRDPQRWLEPGDELVSYVHGIGELRHRFVCTNEQK